MRIIILLLLLLACVWRADSTSMTTAAVRHTLQFDNAGRVEMNNDGYSHHAGSQVTAQVWARVHTHKSHNWLLGTASRSSGWAMFVDGSARVSHLI